MSRYLDAATVMPFLIGALVALFLAVVIYQFRIFKLRLDFQRQIKEATKRSVDQSRSTLNGQIAEHIAPVLPGFSYLPAGARLRSTSDYRLLKSSRLSYCMLPFPTARATLTFPFFQ